MAHTGTVRIALALAAALLVAVPTTADANPLPTATIPAAAASPRANADPVVGLTVPWAIGGMRYEADGTLNDFPGEWPTIPFDAIRLWDTRTAWLNLEPRDGHWDFTRLDAFVAKAQARGVTDISLVLGGTPRWAAKQTRPTDAPWMGRGSASPPKRMADWADFVATVAERYRGRITSYEIWNEPDNVVFWSGTRAQWAQLVAVAAQQIRRVDPAATVVASGFRMRSPRDVSRVTPWIDALRPTAADLDAISFHWYPASSSDLAQLSTVAAQLATRSRAIGVANPPWITEINVRDGADLSARAQAQAVATLTTAATNGGAASLTWYAWTDLTQPDLMPLYPRTPAARAVAATVRR